VSLRERWQARRGPGRLPEALAQALGIDAADHILAWAVLPAGGAVAATRTALVVRPGGAEAPERWPWERIAKARWAEGRLEIVGSPGPAQRTRTWSIEIADGEGTEGDRLAEAVRACVTATVLWSQRIEDPSVDQPRGAWIAARRPAGTDEVSWTVVFDPGLDPSDDGLRRWADVQVEEVRRQTGL
jgi:hypothetical protein